MKKFFPLCLLLLFLAATCSISVAGDNSQISTTAAKMTSSEENARIITEKNRKAEEILRILAEREAAGGGIKSGKKVDFSASDHRIGESAAKDYSEYDKVLMQQIKDDGIISESERADYERLLSMAKRIELPVPFNTVSETEPNDSCQIANAIDCGDTVWCATLTDDSDDNDWFAFALDETYPYWLVTIETHPTGNACDPSMTDTYLELWTGDCDSLIAYNDDIGYPNYFSRIVISLTPGNYVINSDNYYSETGSYHLSLLCEEAPDPHDCGNPIVVSSLPYSDLNQFTCGRIDNYDNTCLGDYDGGEDIIYQLNLAVNTSINITVDFKSTSWGGFAIDNVCPPGDPCIAYVTGWESGEKRISDLALAAGTYYIMVDTWPQPDCIPDFDITIEEYQVCDIECPVTSILEGEPPCSTNYDDTYNGGCNSSPPVFSYMNCGDTICGETGTFLFGIDEYRDTDWYEFTTTTTMDISVTGCAEVPLQLGLLIPGSPDPCTDFDAVVDGQALECDTLIISAEGLPAGTYWVWVGPSVFSGWPCGSEYWMTLECVESIGRCCYVSGVDTLCADTTELACNALGGEWDAELNCIDDPCVCPEDIITIEIMTDEYPGETTWELQDTLGNIIDSGGPLSLESSLYSWDICVDSTGCYNFIIYDAIGDGICCDYGYGYYNVYLNGDLKATGGEFGSSETVYYVGNGCPLLLGMCCYGDFYTPTCVDTTQEACIALGGTWDMDKNCIDDGCPSCNFVCPTTSIPEGEPPCSTGYDDVYNGGCNSSPPVFSYMSCGDTICGETGTFLFGTDEYRDTDWFEFTLTAPRRITATGSAEVPLLMFLIDAGSGDCVDYTQLTYGTADECDTLTIDAGIQPVGTYWLWVGPSVFSGWPCGGRYWATVDCLESPNDVGPTDFVSGTATLANQPYTPVVEVTNFGTDSPDVPVRLIIDTSGVEIYNEMDTILAIPPIGTANATFPDITPVSGASYTMTAITELATVILDQNPGNDTLSARLYVWDTIRDFESDNGDLVGGGDWEWGTPTSGPGSAYSGVNVWATVLAGDYTEGLHTLQFQLEVGTANPSLGIVSWYDTESRFDGGNFAVSTDGGASWITISPDRGYDDSTYSANPLDPDSLFTGHNQGYWENVAFDLSVYAGQTVDARFAFGADGSVFYPGWYIDNLALTDCSILVPDIDVTPASITGEADPGLADYDTVTVSNTGNGTLNFTATAYMDETFTDADGEMQLLISEDPENIRRIPENASLLSNSVGLGETQLLEQRKAEGEKFDAPSIYTIPSNPLPVIDVIIASENFDDGSLPADWSIVDGGSAGLTWQLYSTSSCTRTIPSLSIDWMIVDSDCEGSSGYTFDEQLLTAYYDCSSYSNVHLAFNHDYNWWSNDSGRVEIRNGSTGTWNWLASYSSDVTTSEDFDVTSLIGAGDSVQIRFYYWGVFDYWWAIDDFLLYERDTPWLSIDTNSGSIPPVGSPIDIEVTLDAEDVGPGIYTGRVEIASNDPDETVVDVPVTFVVGGTGTIAGQVTDANTASPVEGAVVTATWVSSTTIIDTTDTGGNYSIVITPGTVNVTIEKEGYITDSQDVTVVEDQTTTHDVVLTAPIVSIDTSPVIDTVAVGDTAIYERTLSNTGSGALDYFVTLTEFDPDNGLLGIKLNPGFSGNESANPATNLISEFTDLSPAYTPNRPPAIAAYQDVVFYFDAETPTGDDGVLGLEFDGTYFWVTGRNASGGDIHKIHKFDRDGNLMMSYDQGTVSDWGWRDMACDGAYLYASDSDTLVKIDISTGSPVPTGTGIPGPLDPNRALAYDPVTDHFWTGDYSEDIYEFDRSGAAIDTIDNPGLAIYGMAWDDVSAGGPFLWIYSQDGSTGLLVTQFDPSLDVFTGVAFEGTSPYGDGGIAGGVCFTTDWHPLGKGILFGVSQDTIDHVIGWEITPPAWLTVVENGSGTIDPAGSAIIKFKVDFTLDVEGDSTYEADANINNNSADPTPVIHFTITAEITGCDYVVGDVNGSDNYNGLDITFGVAYFKGGQNPFCPFGSCGIPPCDAFFYCGDVNGSCSYNGLDITYGVAYFKGGPGPIPCPSCPPLGGPASESKKPEETPQVIKSKTVNQEGNDLK